MISGCPKCKRRLKKYAVSCGHCGWTLDEGITQAVQEQDSPPPSAEPDSIPILEVDSHVQQAHEAIERGDFASALRSLNRAIVDAPADRLAGCYSLRGYVFLKIEDFSRAEADCTDAINRHLEDAQTYAWRAAARGEQNKWPGAFDDLADACRLAGEDRDQYLGLMASYCDTGAAYFREIIKGQGESADLFFDRGWMYYRAGKLSKAERDFQHALELDRQHPAASLGLAQIKMDSGHPKEAIELCNVALRNNSADRRQALEIRARASQACRASASVTADLEHLRRLAGSDTAALLRCGQLKYELGDHIGAIGDLNAAYNANEHNIAAILARADCFRAIRNYALAIEDYTKYLRFQPDDIHARVNRGKCYVSTRQYDRALIDFDRVLEIDNVSFEAFLGRSQVFLAQKQLDAALAECNKAARLDNHNAGVFSNLAGIYFEFCDYSAAIEEYSRAIELSTDPELRAQNLYQRGLAYYELGHFDQTLNDMHQANLLRPYHSGSWIWKAAASARLEKWSLAIHSLQQAIAARPAAARQYHDLGAPVAKRAIAFFTRELQRGHNSAEVYRSRGMAHQFLNQLSEAIEDYSMALKLEPDHAETLIRRGQAFGQQENHAAAISDFSAALHRQNDSHLARHWRAQSLLTVGNLQKAKSDAVKAIKQAGDQPKYHTLHGDILQKEKEWARAVKAYNRAIRLDSNDPATYRKRGLSNMAGADYARAIHDFTHSLDLDPTQLEVLVQRGQAYLKEGQIRSAQEDFELALTHNSHLVKAYTGRASALVAQGLHEAALIWLTKAIHRFEAPRELSEILFSRGKVFYQMSRFEPAISDFSYVINLLRGGKRISVPARLARAAALVQNGDLKSAEKDLRRVLALQPNNLDARQANEWLKDGQGRRPLVLSPPESRIRPIRPPVVRKPLETSGDESQWNAPPPFDTWILRANDDREYGPLHKQHLNVWATEGRLDAGMKLLRADWSKWQRIEKVFPDLDPHAAAVEKFPGIQQRQPSA